MTTKTCTKCGKKKPVSEFNRQAASKDGLKYQCKACTGGCQKIYQVTHKEALAAARKIYCAKHKEAIASSQKSYRLTHKETIANYQKSYRAAHKEATASYRRSLSGKESQRKSDTRCRLKYPEKEKARQAVKYAVSTGRLIRLWYCERCFITCQSEAHHLDYSKPLEVEWLCFDCHKKLHKREDVMEFISEVG